MKLIGTAYAENAQDLVKEVERQIREFFGKGQVTGLYLGVATAEVDVDFGHVKTTFSMDYEAEGHIP